MKINKLKSIFTIRETLIIICGILVHLYFSPAFNYYDHHKKTITIEEGISKVARTCGEGYFVSWLSMDIKGLKDQFLFKDVVGCNKQMSKDCTFSVKAFNLNPFYNKIDHKIDLKTYKFLLNIPDTEVAYFDNIKELNKYNTIKYINDNTNLQINNLSFTVIKNKKENIIYVFSLANTNKKDTCTRKKSTLLLKELAQTAKEGIY